MTLIDSTGVQVGSWPANNVVDRAVKGFPYLPNRVYHVHDTVMPHKHRDHPERDTLNGSFGTRGIIRLRDFTFGNKVHSGVGVHAGQFSRGKQNHPTHGCVRTTEEAMRVISEQMQKDPLTELRVVHNHNQHNAHPHHVADHHN